MFRFVTSLFGCAHQHCTFPITTTQHKHHHDATPGLGKTYVVCLDCGKEFPYDWQQMKLLRTEKHVA